MEISDEKIQEILELKEHFTQQLEKHEEEIEWLRKNLAILDSLLKKTSFTKASQLHSENITEKTDSNLKQSSSIPITKGTNGQVIANAFVTPDQVSIILEDGVELDSDTPPFKSFFLDRIIGEMKPKDTVDADSGKIQKDTMIDYIINKNGSDIREIIIKNYRQEERVKEIINTAGWSFSRMLENMNK